jgi:hypothetical protein
MMVGGEQCRIRICEDASKNVSAEARASASLGLGLIGIDL